MRHAKAVVAFLVLALCCLSFTAESAAPNTTSKVTGVTVSAGELTNLGNNDMRYNFTGSITVDGPAVVEYMWLRNDDVKVHTVKTVAFNSAGTQNVQSYWNVTKTGQVQHLWVEIKVLSPSQKISKRLEFTVPAAK